MKHFLLMNVYNVTCEICYGYTNMYLSPVLRVITSRRIRCGGRVTWTGDIRGVHKILVRKP
jgi:hypothetical protein